jgi:hypothetical protein
MAVRTSSRSSKAANGTSKVANGKAAANGTTVNGNGANGDTGDETYTAEQLQPLLNALRAARSGDFSARVNLRDSGIPRNGLLAEIHHTFNDVIGLNETMAKEVVRVGRIVGREGRMTERAPSAKHKVRGKKASTPSTP